MFKRNKFPGEQRSAKARAPLLLAATFMTAAWLASDAARASTVTFDWQQISGNGTGSGTLTLSSSLLTPSNATGATQFSLMAAQIVAAGETDLGDVAAFTFTLGAQSLTAANMTANSTGWADTYPGEPNNVLESTWSASRTTPGGILQVVGNSTPTSLGDLVTATMGTLSVTGEWVLAPPTPVPLPASAGLMLGAAGLIVGVVRRPRRLAIWVVPGTAAV
jgi:hypothetical protein